MGWVFYPLAFLTLASALGVVLFRNPINSALSLILNLLMVAALFADLDAHFLAAAQIIVYAGAIMVLVMFVIMLLNAKAEPPTSFTTAYLLVSSILALIFVVFLGQYFSQAFPAPPQSGAVEEGTVANIGRLLYGSYIYPFEIASILIFVGIVGAVFLAKRQYQGSTEGGGR